MEAVRAPAPFTGRKMLLSMVAFFGVIIVVNVTMMTFALDTHTGLVVKNSYVASQDFSKRAAHAKAQAALGWTARLAYDDGVAALQMTGPDGAAVTGLTVEGVIGRPVSAAYDRAITLAETAPGVYAARADLGPGEWRLTATATGPDGTDFKLIRDVTVRGTAR